RRPKIDPTTKTLVSGEHVAIYRSDDKGAIEEYYETVDDGDGGTEEVAAYRGASGGDSLWTVARASSADAWGTPELLASGISSLEFSVATDLEGYAIADLIYVTLSVQQSSGSNTESWTTTTAVAVGNH
ncbi:MAG TPA: hypothetical protein QGH10_24905, partial [Armatimonadota bacterium]|nr:hypothetical protein [Armatimonadota bacterium]